VALNNQLGFTESSTLTASVAASHLNSEDFHQAEKFDPFRFAGLNTVAHSMNLNDSSV